VHTLMQHDLVDEYRLMVFPVVLGSGRKLFPDSERKWMLKLADSISFPSGVTVQTYVPPAAHERATGDLIQAAFCKS
jgi:dihydrofolate reductase